MSTVAIQGETTFTNAQDIQAEVNLPVDAPDAPKEIILSGDAPVDQEIVPPKDTAEEPNSPTSDGDAENTESVPSDGEMTFELDDGNMVNDTAPRVSPVAAIDNKRSGEVKRLRDTCHDIIVKIEGYFTQGEARDRDSLTWLEKTAKASDFDNLDAYIHAAYAHLGGQERAKYDQMGKGAAKLDPQMAVLHKIFGGIVASGCILPIGKKTNDHAREFYRIYDGTQAFILFFTALCKSLLLKLKGDEDSARRYMDYAKDTLKLVPANSQFLADNKENVLSMGGNIFVAFKTLLAVREIIPFIAQYVENPKENSTLRNDIMFLGCSQFILKKLENEVRYLYEYRDAIQLEILVIHRNNRWLKKKLITPMEAIDELKRHTTCIRKEFTMDIETVTNKAVLEWLKEVNKQHWNLNHIAMLPILNGVVA